MSKLSNRFSIVIHLALMIYLSTLSSLSFSQNITKYIGINAGAGIKMLPDNKKFNKSIFNGNVFQIQLSYMTTMKNSDAEWVRRLNVKYQSFNLSYRDQSDFDGVNDSIPGVFGNVISLNYNLYNRLIGNENIALYLLPGFGLSYDTKTYYQESRNNFIGTHLNFLSSLELAFIANINARTMIMIQGGYFHYSNAAVVLPNMGVNSINTMVGFRYQLK
ncbi:MAG: acyloxyacyl hydrolase [bacterium]|jgi:hypothetical protein